MSFGSHHAWLPPGNLRPPDDSQDSKGSGSGSVVSGLPKSFSFSGSRMPVARASSTAADGSGSHAGNLISEADVAVEEDPRIAIFRDLYKRSEARIHSLFEKGDDDGAGEDAVVGDSSAVLDVGDPESKTLRADESAPPPPAPAKKPARKLDDDDYDDYDEEDEAEAPAVTESAASPVKSKGLAASFSHDASGSPSPGHRPSFATSTGGDGSKEKKESLEDIRKKLEEDKRATEDAAKRSFHTLFYTLENDRDAMLDQQRLEESERQVEAEMSGQTTAGANNTNSTSNGYGSLSSANLGASSLTLKNLIARIDMKRTMVQASDAELRSLMSEVRKNRSKWASEDKIGQEELYEAAEKVLSELKAMTEHSTAFLTRVNKRDAPDYYTSEDTLVLFSVCGLC